LNDVLVTHGVAVLIEQDGGYWLVQSVKLRRIDDIVQFASDYGVTVSP
jgi:hypothetical protein